MANLVRGKLKILPRRQIGDLSFGALCAQFDSGARHKKISIKYQVFVIDVFGIFGWIDGLKEKLI
ncbi:MAG: hypothetical protein A2359_01480 [Candidatus Moranbacteria bacterium RIFOXYB1_FULL_43_19]|nr:MAG: hypothetical protein A2359_01480 [Candidatus Moranbacteria bacterium RIFOXYB1_FULL_43_19]OGI33519.1 MAG: hypothetical protein A2420_00115 [Candidatus Moranbacteria bacterium RIFOXYC1_FULL_44_13]OGI38393.1 MAG: hypothetical protein A2612_02700 [Candidatus Moranbacteria bacterium RIFOXYD1_FULL_44_12]